MDIDEGRKLGLDACGAGVRGVPMFLKPRTLPFCLRGRNNFLLGGVGRMLTDFWDLTRLRGREVGL